MSLPPALTAITSAGRLILKEYHPQSVLLLARIVLLFTTHFSGMTSLSDLVRKSTGFGPSDASELIRDTLNMRFGGLDLQIMLVSGFATYMSAVDVNQILVRMIFRPLQRLNSPYLLLGLVLLLDQFLSLLISSAIGLDLLLVATFYPLLTHLGCGRAVVAVVIVSTYAVELGPGSGNSVLATKIVGIEVVNCFVQDQSPVVVSATLFIALLHIAVQHFLDRRESGDSTTQ